MQLTKDYSNVVNRYKKETEKECFEIIICDGVNPTFMDNKLGGTPYFPYGAKYPETKSGKAMALLLQINLKDVELEEFPKEGILEIFVDAEFGWPIEYKIYIFKEGYRQADYIPTVNLENFIFSKPMKIKLRKTVSHMPISDYRFYETVQHCMYCENEDVSDVEQCINALYDVKLSIPYGCLGGYADFTQDDPRDKTDNRDFCLFKLDSCLHKSIMIGDCGILTVTISKEDLKSGKVENAVVDWDCC